MPLLFSIILKSNKNHRHFLIPLSGIGVVFFLASTYYAFIDNDFLWFAKIDRTFSFDFLPYRGTHLLLPALITFGMVVGLTIRWFIEYPQTSKKNRLNYIVLIIVLISCLGIVMLSGEKTGAEFIFLYAPISILFANYIEKINTKLIKEFVLWAVIIAPVIILIL
jgi:hypothetical protein